MDVIFIVLGVMCVVLSFVGCIVPAIPGPLLAFAALLCLLPTTNSVGWVSLVVGGVIMLVASVLDYVVPAFGAKKFKCSGSGVTGCMIGTVVGMFFMPIGLFLGPFLGAVVGEVVAGRNIRGSVQGGFGALLGFLAGTAIKIVACGILATMFTISSCRGKIDNGNVLSASVETYGEN